MLEKKEPKLLKTSKIEMRQRLLFESCRQIDGVWREVSGEFPVDIDRNVRDERGQTDDVPFSRFSSFFGLVEGFAVVFVLFVSVIRRSSLSLFFLFFSSFLQL